MLKPVNRVWKQELDRFGWVAFSRGSIAPSLRELSDELEIQKMSQMRLRINTADVARPNTLSSRHGLGAFPPHTDNALASPPPRYIIFCAPRQRTCKTLIFRADVCAAELWAESVFVSRLRGQSHYKTATIEYFGERGIRYNAACMLPQNEQARSLTKLLRDCNPSAAIDWIHSSRAIIDNWRCLHGRDFAEGYDIEDYIRRIWGWI